MGKQRSFIIVSISFVAFILVILLVKVVTSGLKETEIKFLDEEYVVEVGKQRALAPEIYASGDDIGELDFAFTTETEGIIEISRGSWSSSGVAAVLCWSFNELDSTGKTVVTDTKIPYNASDEVTVQDGYWCINGEQTIYEAKDNYSASEIEKHCGPTADEVQMKCYILNGVQTSIPCEDGVEPVTNEETGTWFIKGKDTGYTYKGVQVTIKALNVGVVTLKMTGMIKGKLYEAATNIKVAAPDPASVTLDSKYEEGLIFVKKGENFNIDYKVNAKADSVADPLQDVDMKIKTNNGVVTLNNNTFKAEKVGVETITITASKSSFTLGKYETTSATAEIVVLEELNEEVMANIVSAYKAINNIGTVTKSDKSKESIELAQVALEGVDTSLVPNYSVYEKACRRLFTTRVNAAVTAINAFSKNLTPEENDANRKQLKEALSAKQAVEDVKSLVAKYMNGDELSSDFFAELEVQKYEDYKKVCSDILDKVALYVAANWQKL